MSRWITLGPLCYLILMFLVGVCVTATDAQMFFSADKNGQARVTNVQEGSEIWIVVVDGDENIDCDVRDKIWTEIKLMDPKTGAYMDWERWEDPSDTWPFDYRGNDGCTTNGNYLEETAADSGVFVSNLPVRIGSRIKVNDAFQNTHWVGPDFDGIDSQDAGHWATFDYHGAVGDWIYYGAEDSTRSTVDAAIEDWDDSVETRWHGRFENMDSLWGLYQDQNDFSDVAIAMMKIIDTEATISWDKNVYPDGNEAATITVVDPDENLDCSHIEAVPVFILVNPGSWNPVNANPGLGEGGNSPTNFCMLLRSGGVRTGVLSMPVGGDVPVASIVGQPIRWHNIYNQGLNADHRYYIQYDPRLFATTSTHGITPVLFYAWETGTDTGVFQLNLNSILTDLEFNELYVRDVLVAYYLDPNDFDDFKLATTTIEERRHSITSFTDANRADKDLYWIGRDPVYVQVIDANANVDPCCPEQVVVHICDPHGEDDAEWLILDETSSNSPVFFTFVGMQLWPVWDALGVGLTDLYGGFQLQLDNWKIEAFNEDDILARYNDVAYSAPITPSPVANDIRSGLAGLGDANVHTSFPPSIARVRVANDVSLDLMSIADTQVYDGSTVTMYFLDRQGNRVSGYVNSDCVFIEVIDPDQDEDSFRRERIDAFWDGGQNWPFGPMPLNDFICNGTYEESHPINSLLGDTNIFNNSPQPYDVNYDSEQNDGAAKLYVLNPRNGRWAAVDLLETGIASGDFVSVICIDLASVHTCVPTLGALPGDTIIAAYQDPSNHSDSAMISVKVGIGGGGTPPSQQSTTMFVDAQGNEVTTYTDADLVHVKVTDPSHAGAALLANAVEIDGETYDLTIWYDVQTFAVTDTFMTEALDLDLTPGESITATYTDPADPTDTSSDTISIIAGALDVERFYAAPSPFDGECTFGYVGSGIANMMSVEIYNLAGSLLWESELGNTAEIVWDGTSGEDHRPVGNGAYIYVIEVTDGTNSFSGTGTVFIRR